MLIRPLFKRYQKQLLSFANSDFGKRYLGINTDNPVVKITPDGWHELLDKKTYRATFYSRSPYLNVFREALTSLELANGYKPEQLIKRPSDFIYHPYVYLSTLTKNPDADPETTTVDGWIGVDSKNESFASIRADTATFAQPSAANAGIELLATTTSNQYSDMYRVVTLFDTSSLGSGATISAAEVDVYVTSHTDNYGSQSFSLVESTPASNTNLVTGDYANVGTTLQSTAVALASLTDNAYNTFALNATGLASISKTGITKFGFRSEPDRANSAPTWGSNKRLEVIWNASDTGSNKPKLVVTYTLPTGGSLFYSQI